MFEIISWWEVASIPDGRRPTVCQDLILSNPSRRLKGLGWLEFVVLLSCHEFLPAETSRLWFTRATLRPVALMSCLFLLLFLKCHGNILLPRNISIELWLGGCTTHRCLPSSDMTMTSFQQFTWWRNIWHWLPVVVLDHFTTCQYSVLERPCVIAIILDSVKQTQERTLWKNTEKLNLYFFSFLFFLTLCFPWQWRQLWSIRVCLRGKFSCFDRISYSLLLVWCRNACRNFEQHGWTQGWNEICFRSCCCCF